MRPRTVPARAAQAQERQRSGDPAPMRTPPPPSTRHRRSSARG
ncbi:hypothetical protein [Candidatus Viridilinea mediisalina]|nr:hypothetical protein [Candidatus Viridilinea mediisalina]